MKKNIHPENYRLVVFKDMSCDHAFLTKSSVSSKETIKWEDGNDYPLIKLEISDKSHPFYTGKMKLVDTAGRVDKFKTRYAKKQQEQASILDAKIKAIKEEEEKADKEREEKIIAAEAQGQAVEENNETTANNAEEVTETTEDAEEATETKTGESKE